jgi:hypothetical protein
MDLGRSEAAAGILRIRLVLGIGSSSSSKEFGMTSALIHVDIENFVRLLGRGEGLECVLQVFPQFCKTWPVSGVQFPAPGHQGIPRAAQ